MLAHTSASLRTGIVRLVVVSAVLVASFAIATGTASAHDGHGSGHHYGWSHSWGWSHRHGHCDRTPTPTAAFSVDPASPFAGDSVNFNASASTAGTVNDDDDSPVTAKIVKYDWNFGDGATSSGVDPTTTHSFGDGGTFIVSLTVTNDGGKSATVTQSLIVAPLPVPTAAFSVDPAGPTAQRVTSFDASAATGGESSGRVGTIVKYDWDFGDGATASGADSTTTHSFLTAGTVSVKLTVTNDSGKSASTTQSLDVATVPTPVPTAAFTVIPSAPVAGRDIQFDASASSGGQDRDTTGTIVSYEWDFGDASAGTSATTTHVFAAGGVFVVKLTVTNDAGQSDTAQQTLEVAPPPPPYDPGGGAGGGGINPSSVSPMSVQSLVTSSSIAGTVKLGVAVSFELPAGSKAGACSGDGSVLVSSGSLHKVSGKAAAAASGSSCQLRFKVSLPKGYAGKKAKFAFAFAGNQSVAPWATTRKLLVK